jgi:serine/threonine protein kinase
MGRVYMAHDTLLDRIVAIKFLAMQRTSSTDRSRFLTEARALARLSHPYVITIYRVEEISGSLFLVSEFIRGQSLDRGPRPMPWPQVLKLGIGLARGLAAAHRQQILHRVLFALRAGCWSSLLSSSSRGSPPQVLELQAVASPWRRAA